MTILANSKLTNAKNAKNDEFYTQYSDIEKEMNAYLEFDANVFKGKTILLPCDDPEWSDFTRYFSQNFERFGIKKLISTSYGAKSKLSSGDYQPTLFEEKNVCFDKIKSATNGKIFTLSHDENNDGKVDIKDLQWRYLEGDGDFRSEEIIKLRDEADIIVTNPPFSLFREFVAWVSEANKKIVVIGNMNAITYKEVFPLIKENRLWVGATNFNVGMYFKVPDNFIYADSYKFQREQHGHKVSRVPGVCWFSNIDHGKRHLPLPLMSKADNNKFNKNIIKNPNSYKRYENYDAIEIPFASGIPHDFDGIMGVPISFLNKYSPEQFEIVGMCENEDLYLLKTRVYDSEERKEAYKAKFNKGGSYDLNASGVVEKDGLLEKVYQRVLIRHRSVN